MGGEGMVNARQRKKRSREACPVCGEEGGMAEWVRLPTGRMVPVFRWCFECEDRAQGWCYWCPTTGLSRGLLDRTQAGA